ncbi:MAG: CaiB/BaiF CoA transferase family protein [Candidatus Sericytochromatia bacterium]
MKESYFKSLRVLELASVLAGPAVGVFFAELGAEVVKVENLLTGGDVTRSWRLKQEAPDSDISAYFSSVNWGKRSLALDLRQPEALQIVSQLADRADIVIANYKPGDAEKLGVDYASLSARNPRLIYAHLTGYGSDNPRSGFDALIQAETGFVMLNGEPDGPGLKMPVALMDLLAAHQIKEAILVALLERQFSGQGVYLPVGLFQSGLVSLANQAAAWLVARQDPQRMGSEHPSIVPYGTVYTTSDQREIMLAIGNDRQFQLLCQVLGCPELSLDPRFLTNPERVKFRQLLHPLLQAQIQLQQRDALLASLWEVGVPAGALHTVSEALAKPEAQALLLDSPLAGSASSFGIKGLRTLAFEPPGGQVPLLPPPHLGQHSLTLLAELGLAEFASEWLARGVISGPNVIE